ncbi:MAG: auxin-responsive promoter [Bacteroidetes bacterium]|jgi:hypothetical protein|nr:auxin-responsive promoter [Bacteroidota bacterium]
MPIINSIAAWLMKKRMHQIDLFMKYPHDVQEEWLRRLLKNGAETEFGKKYDFSGIGNYEQFKRNIPLQDYETLKPYIERIRRGEQGLLWNEEIKWFAKSSGTTSDKSKFIPVSPESLDGCHYNGGRDMVTIHCVNNPETNLFTGKNLALGGSHQTDYFGDHESYHGDVSAIVIQNLPIWAEYFRAPDINIALMSNWEEKLKQLVDTTKNANVTSLAGVPSWMLVLLREILKEKKVASIREVWPNLEVYFHGGVSFTPYAEQFRSLLDNEQISYLELYNASEGFFGIQDQKEVKELLLMLDYGIYYEFIPVEDIEKENPRVYNLSEITIGVVYSMVITTTAGLWRYQLGDTIKFTGINPYRFVIVGRTKHNINVFGEELMIHNAEQALRIACGKTHAQITDYTAAPVFMTETSGAHEWLIEFEKEPNNLEYFTDVLDKALQQVNSDYEAKRFNNYILKLPIVKALPSGTFMQWMRSKNKLGGQHKVPRLFNERKYVNEILGLLK